MSVEKNLRYGAKKRGAKPVDFDSVVDLLKLNHLLKSKPSQISGGERQRTALGRSLLSSPDILLLDEPFSAVDARLRSQIIPFLLQIHREINIPILVVSHDLPDLLKLSNSICVIKNGRCLGHDDYFQLMKSEEIARIFGTEEIMNSIKMQVETIDQQNNLTILRSTKGENRVRLKTNGSTGNYKEGQVLTFFLNADDIALAVEKPKGLTIQNQLKGKVTDLITIGSSTLCQVDVGFKLTAEITNSSLKYLKIGKGSAVWCLFKSVAVDVA